MWAKIIAWNFLFFKKGGQSFWEKVDLVSFLSFFFLSYFDWNVKIKQCGPLFEESIALGFEKEVRKEKKLSEIVFDGDWEIHEKNSGLESWVQPVLHDIKASTAIFYSRITTVNHCPCYKTTARRAIYRRKYAHKFTPLSAAYGIWRTACGVWRPAFITSTTVFLFHRNC